jgi:hypothetical protein
VQRTNDSTLSPDEYVSENVDELVHVVKQSTDPWIRGLCLAALVKYNDDEYDIDQVYEELDEIREDMKDA